MSLRDDKRELRERVLTAREALDERWRAQASQAIAAGVTGLDGFAKAEALLLTLPFRSEWNAMLVVERALAAGKIVAVPRVEPAERMLRAYRIADAGRDIEPGYRGIPEPRVGCPAIALDRIDWVLVPGVAFDTAGRRLGYGGGYYDRLLPFVSPTAARVAGAFDMQIVDAVPTAAHDLGVDVVVTEQRTLYCGDHRE
jgi:5-formyltetrahydrofolate cyclo-ligase